MNGTERELKKIFFGWGGALVSSITDQPKEDMNEQLKELSTNSVLGTMCQGMAKVSLTIPMGTVSVERSFSQMKMIKTRLRNSLGDTNLSHLMKVVVESPQSLSDEELEQIIDIWNRKSEEYLFDV